MTVYLNDPDPSLPAHYSVSSLLRSGPTSTERGQYGCSLVLRISHVLFQCLCKGHAVCITVGAQPVNRFPLRSSLPPSHETVLLHNFCGFVTSSTVHLRSSPLHLHATFYSGFSLSVHHLLLADKAAQSCLTISPA